MEEITSPLLFLAKSCLGQKLHISKSALKLGAARSAFLCNANREKATRATEWKDGVPVWKWNNAWEQMAIQPRALYESDVCSNCRSTMLKLGFTAPFCVWKKIHYHECVGSSCRDDGWDSVIDCDDADCNDPEYILCDDCIEEAQEADVRQQARLLQTAEERWMRWIAPADRWRKYVSKYNGVCPDCREDYNVGDEIGWLPKGGAVHLHCAPLEAQELILQNERIDEFMVKFFKFGNEVGVQTDERDHAEFNRKFTDAFLRLAEDYPVKEDLPLVSERLLARKTQIDYKFGGYKADVIEQRLITSGEVMPAESACIMTVADNGKAIPANVASNGHDKTKAKAATVN